jgi:hypothetical protein
VSSHRVGREARRHILPDLGGVLPRPDHSAARPAAGACPVGRFKAVEPTQAEGGHGDEAAGQGEGGRDAVRADEAMSGSDDLADAWPHRNHSAATLALRAGDGNAKFIHLSTAIHI